MIENKKIRLLIVDDSLLFQEVLTKMLSESPSIEVVGTANDAIHAQSKIAALRPDVITLDIEMPRMNGIEFLRQYLPKNPIPVVVISSVSSYVFEAMDAGAVDFVTKPGSINNMDMKTFANELIRKIRIARVAAVRPAKVAAAPAAATFASAHPDSKDTIIAIGASTGGTEAILQVLRTLPANMPGIVIVQHMPPVFTKMYAERINGLCKMTVTEAVNGDKVTQGHVLLAAGGDRQMRVIKDSLHGGYAVKYEAGAKVSGHCPSVDVLFESVALAAGSKAVGVILTGMGSDGARGLLQMRKAGAFTIGQDESSCVVYGMPMVAQNIGAVARQWPLDEIAGALQRNLPGK